MLVKINWTPDKKKLRSFGWQFLVMFVIVGALLAWRFHSLTPGYVLAAIGAVVAVLCAVAPPLGIWAYRAWMGLGYCMGLVMAPLFLGLVYYLCITPMGLLLRLFGKDPLQSRKPNTESLWLPIAYRADKASYERQF